MKKSLFISLMLILSFIHLGNITQPKYYVCDNGYTKVYHIKYNCSGLAKCTHHVLEYDTIPTGKRICRTQNGCNGGK